MDYYPQFDQQEREIGLHNSRAAIVCNVMRMTPHCLDTQTTTTKRGHLQRSQKKPESLFGCVPSQNLCNKKEPKVLARANGRGTGRSGNSYSTTLMVKEGGLNAFPPGE